MLKKILFSITTLAMANTSFAYVDLTMSPYLGFGTGLVNAGDNYSMLGTVFAGLDKRVGPRKQYYLAGELYKDVVALPIKNDYNRNTTILSISLLPGIVNDQGMILYARVGLDFTTYNPVNNEHAALQLGVGMRIPTEKNWSVRAEYIYTGSGFFNDFTQTKKQQINLALVYKFSNSIA